MKRHVTLFESVKKCVVLLGIATVLFGAHGLNAKNRMRDKVSSFCRACVRSGTKTLVRLRKGADHGHHNALSRQKKSKKDLVVARRKAEQDAVADMRVILDVREELVGNAVRKIPLYLKMFESSGEAAKHRDLTLEAWFSELEGHVKGGLVAKLKDKSQANDEYFMVGASPEFSQISLAVHNGVRREHQRMAMASKESFESVREFKIALTQLLRRDAERIEHEKRLLNSMAPHYIDEITRRHLDVKKRLKAQFRN